MKFILLTILSTIIIFFVWNIMKKIFFTKFYGNLPPRPDTHNAKSGKVEQKVKWDAETVDYEEVKDKESNN
ncbi:hypothetical protein P0M11_07105 [Kaistella sp. PBT33-4]|uniref:hypothetical protein n=1 Tax=Kaistella sp. PBT33-4 TaxID=3032000 RepID=UPI0023D7EF52|nr:hypothetical protein [Kaistella sp. PBT33-4]MDF0719767.1 hypothetical protein [Kaistella sp. PBT33-4]